MLEMMLFGHIIWIELVTWSMYIWPQSGPVPLLLELGGHLVCPLICTFACSHLTIGNCHDATTTNVLHMSALYCLCVVIANFHHARDFPYNTHQILSNIWGTFIEVRAGTLFTGAAYRVSCFSMTQQFPHSSAFFRECFLFLEHPLPSVSHVYHFLRATSGISACDCNKPLRIPRPIGL